jgi:UDP-N-acetyl-D-glucosamine/UDP-N-acetyl-D-galactosamine dehydrogenase
VRNTRVADLIQELEGHGVDVALSDPLVIGKDLERFKTRIVANPFEGNEKYDAIILAVPHRIFCETPIEAYSNLLANGDGPTVFVDIKGVLGEMRHNKDLLYWSL